MKKIFSILLVIFALTLCACKTKKVDISTLKEDLDSTVETYKGASNVQFKITMQTGDSAETIDVKYSLNGDKLVSLAAVLTDSNGTVSAYVKDGYSYLARYNANKTKAAVTDDEAAGIASNYNIEAFIKKILSVYNSSFFNASSISETNGDTYTLTCDLTALSVAEDLSVEEAYEAEEQLELLRAMTSITLNVTLDGDSVKKLDGTFSKDTTTSKICLEFISTDAFTVEIPNIGDYSSK